mgnify:CR=1 FL=1
MRAKIKNKQEVAKGTLLVEFLLLEPVSYQAGQSFRLTLLNPPYRDEAGSSRFFSIANLPQKDLVTTVTRIRESAFKRSLWELPLRSDVEVGSIGGDFLLPEKGAKPLVFIAGGIGVTPFVSMLRYLEQQNFPYPVSLFYSNPDRQSAAFREDLLGLAQKSRNFRAVMTMTRDPDWPGEKGRLDAKFLQKYLDRPAEALYYLAGPPGFVNDIYGALVSLGVRALNIKTEEFSGY